MMAMPGPPEVTVDCDAGDSLARALTKATRNPGTTIHVQGTCTGSFVVAAQNISLKGDPTTTTVIQGPEDAIANRLTVLDVTVDRFSMRHVTVRRGWIGVHVRGGISTRSDVRLLDSNFEGNYGGVLIDGGSFAFVQNSTFQSNELGIGVQFGSRGSVVDCDIRDSGIRGLDVFSNSTAGMFRTSVSGSGIVGIGVSMNSFLGIGDSTLSENSGVHAIAQDRSKLQIGSNVTLGSDGDGTQAAVFLDDASILRSFSDVEIWGDVGADGSCHLSLGNIALHGSLLLDDFTDANLSRTTVDGVVECQRGSDAFCDTGVTASVSGCASAGSPCTSAPSPPPERLGLSKSGKNFGAIGLRELRSGATARSSKSGR